MLLLGGLRASSLRRRPQPPPYRSEQSGRWCSTSWCPWEGRVFSRHIGVVIQDGDGTPGRLRGDVITGTGITQCEIGCCGFTATAIAAAVAEPIRPEVPGDPAASLPDWAATLGGRPVVYLSLGTVPLFNQRDKFETLLADLAHEDLDVVVTVSQLNDPAALGPQPANVHVERWLPLAPLLPCCDVVVCHAGSGTTLAALSAGLPLVLVPQGADQHTNADACQRAGVARVLYGDAVTSTAVRDAVMAIAEPESPEQSMARRIAAEIAAMPAATEVVQRLQVRRNRLTEPSAGVSHQVRMGDNSR